jgi:hypothetical protein
MGLKLLNMQILPWCFPALNGCLQFLHPSSDPPQPTIKLVKSDGHVQIYDTPINASDLMLEFPKHLVCRSDSFYIGQKIPHLSNTDQLQLGHVYFLLPNHLFQSVLSFVTIASFAAAAARDHNRKLFLKPFEIQKCESGFLRIRVSDDFISHLIEEEGKQHSADPVITSRVCNTQQLDKDYKQLVVTSRRHWKPKLETIKESRHEKRNRKNKKVQSSTKSPLKDRIKEIRCRK